jgi:acetoin utilization deacetylase AcuC-like enzyme
MAALNDDAFAGLARAEAPLATMEELTRVHPAEYVQAILGVRPPPDELAMIDGDTLMSAGSAEAALRAAGAVVAGVDSVLGGKAKNAFAACGRRPSRHAGHPAAFASSTMSP